MRRRRASARAPRFIAGDIPIALAVIPAPADAGLAARLIRSDRSLAAMRLAVLQHGWRHATTLSAARRANSRAERSANAVASDLPAGRARLNALFGARALAVLAPPWNRFDAAFLPLLAACGIGAISRVKPRRAAWPAPGIAAVNVHVDLVAWAGTRGFIGEERRWVASSDTCGRAASARSTPTSRPEF